MPDSATLRPGPDGRIHDPLIRMAPPNAEEWANMRADPYFRYNFDWVVPSTPSGRPAPQTGTGDMQSAHIQNQMRMERDRYGNARVSYDTRDRSGVSFAQRMANYDPNGAYGMSLAENDRLMAQFNKDFDKTGGGAFVPPNVMDDFAQKMSDPARKKAFLDMKKWYETPSNPNSSGWDKSKVKMNPNFAAELEQYKLYQQRPDLYETQWRGKGVGAMAKGGDNYDHWFDASGSLRQGAGAMGGPPMQQGAPPMQQGAPPMQQGAPPMQQGGVANLGVAGFQNGNPFFNKFGNVRRRVLKDLGAMLNNQPQMPQQGNPYGNVHGYASSSFQPTTDWDLNGPGGQALFGAQNYSYLPPGGWGNPMGYGSPSAMPSNFGNMDPAQAMLAFGGF